MTGRRRHILLAEDDPDLRRLIAARLRAFGHKVVEASDGADVIDRLEHTIWGERAGLFDVIVSDVDMPCLSGLDVLAALRCARWPTPVILVTGFDDEGIVADARELGAAAVLHKPLDPATLAEAVAAAVPG